MRDYARTLLLFYRRNVRVQPMRELMAVAGIAAGVALLFTVQVAHRSITGSFQEISKGVAGGATLELSSRGPAGFSERVTEEVESLPGVRASAPLLQESVVAVGPAGRRALTLVGANEQIARLGGKLSARFVLAGLSAHRGLLVLSDATAHTLGVRPGHNVTVLAGGRERHLALNSTVPSSSLGAAAESPLAAAPLPVVQILTGHHGIVSRVLIEPAAGQDEALRRELQRRFGATLNVRGTGTEARLLGNAAGPERQITLLFSAISIVAGIILAYASLLLASDERRRFVVYLIEIGTPESMIIASLVFDALLLGVFGCVLGLILGDLISLVAFRSVPGYIRAAFPVGGQLVVGTATVLVSIAGGMLAAFAAAALPAITILRAGAAAEPDAIGRSLSLARRARLSNAVPFVFGVGLICASVTLSLIAPATTVVALVVLLAGLVMCLPLVTTGILRLARTLSRHSDDPSARLSVAEIRRAPTRSVALLATGAIATFLTVTISGSVADVQRAAHAGASGLLSSGDLWLKPGGPENVYTTEPLADGSIPRLLAHLGEVRTVASWQDSFLDLPNRRVWVLGVPPQVASQIVPSQLLEGSLAVADRRLQSGGWIALSQTIAREDHVGVGDQVQLPTPTGRTRFRVAAIVANYGWLPGAVVMNGSDHARSWGEAQPTQLAVTLAPGVSVVQGKQAVEADLPSGSAVSVQSAEERRHEVGAVLGSTLARLNDTTLVVLIATVASVIALVIAAIAQRRGRLDSLLSIGMSVAQFVRLIFYESGSMLVAGCLIGVGGGLVGQALVDGWLRDTTGASVHFTAAWQIGLRTVLIAAGIALGASTFAVLKATRPQPRAAFSTE
jgi:putative ABC transport system permease protein